MVSRSSKAPKEGKSDPGKRREGAPSCASPSGLPQAAPALRGVRTPNFPLSSDVPKREELPDAPAPAGRPGLCRCARRLGGSMPAPPLAAPLLRALLARLLPLARRRLLPPLRRLWRRLRSRESRQALLTCLLCLLNLRKKADD